MTGSPYFDFVPGPIGGGWREAVPDSGGHPGLRRQAGQHRVLGPSAALPTHSGIRSEESITIRPECRLSSCHLLLLVWNVACRGDTCAPGHAPGGHAGSRLPLLHITQWSRPPEHRCGEHEESAQEGQHHPCHRWEKQYVHTYIQGVPKKTLFSGVLAITPLWKGLEIKVGGVSKNSGNSLSDRHQNFSIWPIRSWENWVQRWQPYLKYLDKNGGFFSG